MFKRILNHYEKITNKRLNEVCSRYGAKVFPKVRVADVFPIDNSGISNVHYSYAMKSHFDFVICDETYMPQFSVEFDGPYHNKKYQKEKDQLKDELCERFHFPLLRINSNYLMRKYKEYDLLSWFVETWFLSIEFHQAQEKGYIPWDEPFDPKMFVILPGRKSKFPMWLSLDIRLKVQKLAKKGIISDPIISHWIGVDDKHNYYGLAWIKVYDDMGVIAQTAMRKQLFPISESEIIQEILCFQVYDQLEMILRGESNGIAYSNILKKVKKYAEVYKVISFASYVSESLTLTKRFRGRAIRRAPDLGR